MIYCQKMYANTLKSYSKHTERKACVYGKWAEYYL